MGPDRSVDVDVDGLRGIAFASAPLEWSYLVNWEKDEGWIVHYSFLVLSAAHVQGAS